MQTPLLQSKSVSAPSLRASGALCYPRPSLWTNQTREMAKIWTRCFYSIKTRSMKQTHRKVGTWSELRVISHSSKSFLRQILSKISILFLEKEFPEIWFLEIWFLEIWFPEIWFLEIWFLEIWFLEIWFFENSKKSRQFCQKLTFGKFFEIFQFFLAAHFKWGSILFTWIRRSR